MVVWMLRAGTLGALLRVDWSAVQCLWSPKTANEQQGACKVQSTGVCPLCPKIPLLKVICHGRGYAVDGAVQSL